MKYLIKSNKEKIMKLTKPPPKAPAIGTEKLVPENVANLEPKIKLNLNKEDSFIIEIKNRVFNDIFIKK